MIKNNKRFYKILSIVICASALSIPLLVGYWNGKKYDRAIRKNSFIIPGTVYSWEHKNKQSAVIKYIFEFEGKKYYSSSGSSEAGLRWEDEYDILFQKAKGKTFPVIFSKDDPGRYNKILISPDDFKEFNISYPDSLNWVNTILHHY